MLQARINHFVSLRWEAHRRKFQAGWIGCWCLVMGPLTRGMPQNDPCTYSRSITAFPMIQQKRKVLIRLLHNNVWLSCYGTGLGFDFCWHRILDGSGFYFGIYGTVIKQTITHTFVKRDRKGRTRRCPNLSSHHPIHHAWKHILLRHF